VVVGHLFAIQQTGDFRREVCALHKGQLSGKQGGDLRRRTAHVVGKIAAVRSRISKQLLFVQGLRQIKGLFCGIAVNAVCFPLQAGKVKEFRRGNGFLLAGNGSTNRLCRFASGFQIPRFFCGVDLRACGFHAGEGQAHKSEEAAERMGKYGVRKVKEGYRSHKLKPYRKAAQAEKAAAKASPSPFRFGNRLWLKTERYSSVLLALGAEQGEAFDGAVAACILPVLYSAGKECLPEAEKELDEASFSECRKQLDGYGV